MEKVLRALHLCIFKIRQQGTWKGLGQGFEQGLSNVPFIVYN